uniref:LRRCT domain-containing protein n=1 Tax=Oncorhynchus tshawytscha TaxID=74940 RepID=A0AAZ3S4N8_ONCTS
MLWVTLLSTIALGWTTPIPLLEDSEEMDEPCFEPCYCQVKEGVFHVHCDSKGFTNVSQISQIWTRPFKLNLQRNSMRKLYFNSFLHLNNAVSINLGNNALQDIHAGAFNGLGILKRLFLHENKLEVFRNDTFLGLESLEYLQADYNVIKRIESGAFRHLHKLRVLILNDNLIPVLPSYLFRSVSLTHLDLRGNRLKTLPYKGTLEYVGRSLMEIQLEENPWICECDIVQLKTWLERVPYTALVGEITCEYPFHLHGKDLREIKRSELCPLLSDAEIEAKLGIPRSPFNNENTWPTKPSSMLSSFHNTLATRPAPIPIVCPSGCICNLHINDLGLTVNCKEKGFHNISELLPRPLNAKKLYLSGNLIQKIYRSDFWNFSSLDLLHLGNNRISYVQEGAFINLPNLKSLYLNGNDIERLTPGMFRGLQTLSYLYFEYNVIREIQPASFSLMPSLQLVFLNDNLLRTLPTDAFAGTSLARLNLRNNYFLSLPVRGVLEHLHSIVQVDLHQNPWDCSCDIIPLKTWMEKLSSVIMVSDVICKTPDFAFGKDLRSLDAEVICPELKYSSGPSPALLPSDDMTTGSSGLGEAVGRGPVPLSVLILSLLVLFISAVFVAAGLFAFVLRRRKKLPFRKRSEVDLTGIQMQCRIFEDPPRQTSSGSSGSPEKPTSGHTHTHGHVGHTHTHGHVYDYIPHPVTQMCNNPIYKPREGEVGEGEGGQFAETKENNSNYRTLLEKEREWTLAMSNSQLNTIVTVNHNTGDISSFHENSGLCPTVIDSQRPTPTVGFVDCLYGTVPKLKDMHVAHAHPPGMQYPDLQQDARLKETLLYTAGKGCYPDPSQSDYLELRAKLQTKPDYLEVLEKSYRF